MSVSYAEAHVTLLICVVDKPLTSADNFTAEASSESSFLSRFDLLDDGLFAILNGVS
jgi:hypothetical protein